MKHSTAPSGTEADDRGEAPGTGWYRRAACLHVLLVSAISAVICFLLPRLELFERAELSILDLRFQRRPPMPTSQRLGTIEIDSQTIDRAGGWPVSRRLYAESLRVLHRYDASLASFDVLFPDPSSLTAPQGLMDRAVQLAAEGKHPDELRRVLAHLAQTPDDDFAAAIGETGFTILSQTFSCAKPELFPDVTEIAVMTRSALGRASDRRREAMAMAAARAIPYNPEAGSDLGLHRAFGIEPPDPKLLGKAAGLGFVQVFQDIDGTMRKYPLLILYDGRLYPSLALEGICRLTSVPLGKIQVVPGRHVLLPGARWRSQSGRDIAGDIKIPVDRYLQMRVNWAGDFMDAFTHVPASVLLRFRAEDLMRERIHSYHARPGDLVEKGFRLTVQDAVDRQLLPEADAEGIAMPLMLAQLAETSQTSGKGSRDEFISTYAPDEQDLASRQMVSAIWDQVQMNSRMLRLLKEDPDSSYENVRSRLSPPQGRDSELLNSYQHLRFVVRRGKDPEQWRPLYFFPPRRVWHEGTTVRAHISPLDLTDKILYVGLTAPGSHDYGPMPFNATYPRVGIHVNAANTILERRFLRELPEYMFFLLALACTLPVACLTSRLHPFFGLALAVTLSTLYLLACGIAFDKAGVWLPALQPVLAITVTYLAIVVHNILREQHNRRKLQRAFSTYVTPAIVKQVLRDPGMLRLGGQRRTMTIFFSDVVGFTSISEKATPEELVGMLNQYFDVVTEAIFRHEGTLDKYQGDGAMAFWNAPADQQDHAYQACCAAMECIKTVNTVLFPKWVAEGKPRLSTRIGINTGPVSVGNMGSSTRMAYTVIGDAVNLASRLEAANKEYGTSIMISQSTFELVRDRIATRQLDTLAVKGRAQPLQVHEVLARAGGLDPAMSRLLDAYNQALALYRARRWQEAADAFAAILVDHPDDGPSKTYLARCRTYAATPPPADWNGVWTLTSK